MGAESRRVIIWELGRWGIRGKSNGIQHSPWEINMVFFVKRARIRVSAWHPSVQSSSVAQSCPTLCDPMNYTVHGMLQVRILEWVAFPFSRDLPNPGIESRSPALQADSLPAEPQGKPMNTGVGSLSLLQWIFLTQDLNQGPLHCRCILYQLSYQGSST